MVGFKNKQFIIDGKAKLILAGEIHYFRLDKADWQDRIDKLKAAGFNAVASYIPWICHESQEGDFDFDGHSRPELDVEGFIELCAQNDLYFIARPGPFIMAEMKNEGIPHWVAQKYPQVKCATWDGRPSNNATIDYLNPDFLRCVRNWYAHIMTILKAHLQPKGGNVIAVQLDNEIGMISWCSNTPDLTPVTLEDFRSWLKENGRSQAYPFPMDDDMAFASGIQSPTEDYVLTLKKDLGHYMRHRTAKYVRALADYAKENGVTQVPYLINIHGTGGGRGLTYMIGVSQLYEAYTLSDEFLSGSDIYLGALDMDNFQDLYLLNGYMESVNRKDQPLTSLEFECGDANYGETYSSRTDISGVDFKTRMCVAQGNRLLNCYLFCGGRNYKIYGLDDGNGRIAITGERHGFAAPVSPEGELNYTYSRMARVMKLMGTHADKLADMTEERDDIALGFIPDYYMTEFCYPKSEREKQMQEDVVRFRGQQGIERFARGMLLNNFRFTSINIQDKDVSQWDTPVLVVFSATYMDGALQEKLVRFMESGRSVLFYGAMPLMDMEGRPCTILKDALGIGAVKNYTGDGHYYLAVQPVGPLAGCAEVATAYAQTYAIDGAQAILETADKHEITAFLKAVGDGKALVMGTHYICHLENLKNLLSWLGAAPGLTQDAAYHGLFMTMDKNDAGEAYLHILNLDGFEKHMHVYYGGEALFEGRQLRIGARDGLMLPLNMTLDGQKIIYTTAEIMAREADHWILRPTQEQDVIVLEGTGRVKPSEAYDICENDGRTVVTSRINGKLEQDIVLEFCREER